MSVIVFAPPQPSLAMQAREVAMLINNFHRPILAQCEDDLRRCIETASDAIQGFWFAGHSNIDGIQTNTGVMTPDILGQYLSSADVEWSFFSSCQSAAFIEQLQSRYHHDCYAYIADVDDTAAWRTAALVAASYADVGNIRRAIQKAAPPGSTPLRFFPSPVIEGFSGMTRETIEQAAELAGQLRELTNVLVGNERYKEPGLIDSVHSLQSRQSFIMDEIAKMQWWTKANTWGLLVLAGIEIWARLGFK